MDGTVEELELSLDRLRSADAGASAAIDVELRGKRGSISWSTTVYGIDGVQATILGLRIARAKLASLVKSGVLIRQHGFPDGDLGLD